MDRLLIVDDEPKLRDVITEYARFNGFDTDCAADGAEAVEKALSQDFDIIVMDIMMPVKDGYTAAKEIREIKTTPIILLSARSEEYDKLFGFQLGIDDYVVKPFSPKELMARINAVITRHRLTHPKAVSPEATKSSSQTKNLTLRFDGLVIDKVRHSITIDDVTVDLTPKEYELLLYLAENNNIPMSRETLLEEVWGYTSGGDDRTIDTHIKNLRNHLGPYRDLIATMRGIGYKFAYEKI